MVLSRRSFRLLLEDTVQEILKLVLTWLSMGFGFHWGQNDVHGIDFLEFAGADYSARELLVWHSWHYCADLALKGAMAVGDRAD